MKIQSPAFDNEERIPITYTCDGENINPTISFLEIPTTAKSLLLIVDDPDAPVGLWTHWIVYNMPPNTTEIVENSTPPGVEGLNSSSNVGYQGPCPPSGTHRYFFRLFALDTVLPDLDTVTREQIDAAMKNHIVEKAELMGTYSRNQ